MADTTKLIARIRSFGANVMLDGNRLTIVNREKLPAGALDHIKAHGKDIAAFLDQEAEFEERAAIMEFDGELTRPAAEYLSALLTKAHPNDPDWTSFVGEAVAIVEHKLRRAA